MPALDKASTGRYNVPGLERGLRLLQLFDRSTTQLGAPDIAKALAVPRTTVFRIVQTLEHLGYLERSDAGHYRLGPAVLRLGFEYVASLEITDIARPIVERLRDETGYSTQLVIRDGRDVVVVLKAQSPSAFSSNVQVGTRLPAHATMLGRVLLADVSDADLRKLYPESRLEAFGPDTPKTVAELARLVRADRARGYATSEAYFERGVSNVVAPVHEHGARVTAAISITLQQPSIDPKSRDRLIDAIRAAAEALSHRLNYRPERAPRAKARFATTV